METVYDYPDRVTRQPDGSYIWRCAIGKEYERWTYRLTIRVCIGIAAFMLAYGAVLAVLFHDLKSFGIVAACVAVFLLITVLICFGLDRLPGRVYEVYHLTDSDIRTGFGRARGVFSFNRTKVMIVGKDHIELKGRFGGPTLFVPEEDLSLVKGYIMSRIPGDAEMRYS